MQQKKELLGAIRVASICLNSKIKQRTKGASGCTQISEGTDDVQTPTPEGGSQEPGLITILMMTGNPCEMISKHRKVRNMLKIIMSFQCPAKHLISI
jgi:hypothetical protein